MCCISGLMCKTTSSQKFVEHCFLPSTLNITLETCVTPLTFFAESSTFLSPKIHGNVAQLVRAQHS